MNETFVDNADFINITVPNLIEYSDNYSDTSGSWWNFKRDEVKGDDNLTIDNAPSFKYKANLIGNTGNNGIKIFHCWIFLMVQWCKNSYTIKIFK